MSESYDEDNDTTQTDAPVAPQSHTGPQAPD